MSTSLDDLRRHSRAITAPTGPQPTSEQVLGLLREHVPGYLASWRSTLLEEVRDAIARAPAQQHHQCPQDVLSSSSSSSSGSDEATAEDEQPHLPPELLRDEVSSRWRGQEKRHIVARGPPSHDLADWVTACGWRFGRSGNAVLADPGHPLCMKCLRAASVA